MPDAIKDLLGQIDEATSDIRVRLSMNGIADPSPMYVEPDAGDGRRGPSVQLRCRTHDWYATRFPWAGGGNVDLVDLIQAMNAHLGGQH